MILPSEYLFYLKKPNKPIKPILDKKQLRQDIELLLDIMKYTKRKIKQIIRLYRKDIIKYYDEQDRAYYFCIKFSKDDRKNIPFALAKRIRGYCDSAKVGHKDKIFPYHKNHYYRMLKGYFNGISLHELYRRVIKDE